MVFWGMTVVLTEQESCEEMRARWESRARCQTCSPFGMSMAPDDAPCSQNTALCDAPRPQNTVQSRPQVETTWAPGLS